MKTPEFTVNDKLNQFELHIEEDVAFLEYYTEDNKIFLTHTEVPEALQGRGYAKELVKQSLQWVKDNKLVAVPACSYVADFVNKNPEWRSILSEGYQM